MKKIVRIIDRLNIGGPTIHVSLLSAKLDNYTTTLVSGYVCKEEGDMSYVTLDYGVEPVYVPQLSREIRLVKDAVALWKIYRLLRREKPHIVHTHKSKAGFIGRMAAILAGVPIVIHTFHGHVFHGYFSPRKTRLFLRIERFLARFTDKIVVISPQQQSEICDKYRIARKNKFAIIPLGFDFACPQIVMKERGWLRERHQWKEQDVVVGIIGRLAAIKNHEMFLDVAERVAKEHMHIKFAIIGDGELRSQLEESVKKRNLQQHVVFSGWVKETAQIYSDIDIVALTSRNEGTPVVAIEGMYYSKPVVATNVGGVSDVVDEDSGFLCEVGDVESFTANVLRLANNTQLREQLGKSAHERSKKMFCYTRLVGDIENLYASL
ncbi:glycosyltransferase [Candidatus Uabimicrobium amorphum]|uniref:Glycosyl transferase family 1 n=1 Tax=Uabimicrobium amorphum TaxID=2596890 RepID=A0A5S9IUC9_UABAM|nr:glycosyltransferase [Candidatus Uabimicrobium amorphum]BBM87796.1 glycosyl transferase family 1 [Candidatus Uabimicrobium amorphum]